MTQPEYYKALKSRDSRFDGLFFTCVETTRIYCRPICPTHAPKMENCSFVSSAAEAERTGFRPCLRCRPELAPSISNADNSPARLLCKHIEETLLMDETLGGIAGAYGMSERHLRRVFVETYGVEPKQYLTTRRLLFAKQLLQDTQLPIIDVAYSSGFNTPGRLTINMRNAYGFTPQRFRQENAEVKSSDAIILRADYRPPLDWEALLEFLKGRTTPLEWVEGGAYNRSVQGHTITVTNSPEKNRLNIRVPVELSLQSHRILRKVRNVFDLDANPQVIQEALSEDPLLAGLIAKNPGIRVPGSWDGFELLLRVIIGQQISVAGATTIMTRLAERIGMTPDAIAASSPSEIATIGMPAKRAITIWEVGRQVQSGAIRLDKRNPQVFYDQFVAVPGIGPWTAEYLCLRVLHWPDAFPSGDLVLQKVLMPGAKRPEKQICERAEAWRPWRSYATLLLWKSSKNNGG